MLGTGYTATPAGRETWDLDSVFRRSRIALLERSAAAVRAGEPGNGAHALAALEVVERIESL